VDVLKASGIYWRLMVFSGGWWYLLETDGNDFSLVLFIGG
jgi:hypothetical protein